MLKAKDSTGKIVYIDNADPNKQYFCQVCGQPVMQRRGEIKAHHFAHYSSHCKHWEIVPCCDRWHYDMSEWHMEWQKRFSCDDIEKVLSVGKDKHIADLLVGNYVVEFQHSPIALKDFEERNNFYTDLGYKVIWLFDLREEYKDGRIREHDKFDGYYSWACPRNLFKSLDLENTKATIYFQFDEADQEFGVLERLVSLKKYGTTFRTDFRNAISVKDFIDSINQNKKEIFGKEKPKEAPHEIEKCSTICELWKPSYFMMLIANNATDTALFVFGKDGELIRDFDSGRIRCRYGKFNASTGRYDKGEKFYNVFDEEKKIWTLIHGFESRKKQNVDNEAIAPVTKPEIIEELKPEPVFVENYQSIEEIISSNSTLSVLSIADMENGAHYYIQSDWANNHAYKTFAVDKETKEIVFDNPLVDSSFKLRAEQKVWKLISNKELFK